MSKHTLGPPLLNKRRPYEDSKPQGYTESDRDYIENNKELCLWFLDNYHLSAAAPELLEACKYLVHMIGEENVPGNCIAAINKAEGREG